MIGAIDRWIGKTLFVPLIIRACQRTGLTQYRFHNYAYLVGSYLLVAAALAKEPDSAGLVLAFAVLLTVMYGRNPDYEGYESPFLRRLFIATNILHIIAHVTGRKMLLAGTDWDWSCPVGLLWLAAEYARTIKTIPPLESQKPASERTIDVPAIRIETRRAATTQIGAVRSMRAGAVRHRPKGGQ
jgi:hypothetical protein